MKVQVKIYSHNANTKVYEYKKHYQAPFWKRIRPYRTWFAGMREEWRARYDDPETPGNVNRQWENFVRVQITRAYDSGQEMKIASKEQPFIYVTVRYVP